MPRAAKTVDIKPQDTVRRRVPAVQVETTVNVGKQITKSSARKLPDKQPPAASAAPTKLPVKTPPVKTPSVNPPVKSSKKPSAAKPSAAPAKPSAAPAKPSAAPAKPSVKLSKKPSAAPANPLKSSSGVIPLYTLEQISSMTDEQITAAINDSAHAILQTPSARSRTNIPFDGGHLRNNPFAHALTVEVPSDIYNPPSVWHRRENDDDDEDDDDDDDGGDRDGIVFEPWIWRLGATPAINRYTANYNRINREPFPSEAFARLARRIRNRGYKRRERSA